MPVERCQRDGKPGFRWGEKGFCYTYERNNDESRDRAFEKARKQGQAIKVSQSRSKE